MSKKRLANKYRCDTTRIQGYDYSSSGSYFITVCTKDQQHYFGKVEDGEMVYSELGHIANASWYAMNRVYQVLRLDVHEVMPNHIHLLFSIENYKSVLEPNKFGNMVKNSVSSILNHFKGRVTKYANQENIQFAWQRRFNDHIVRSESEHKRIKKYILENPKNWGNDELNT